MYPKWIYLHTRLSTGPEVELCVSTTGSDILVESGFNLDTGDELTEADLLSFDQGHLNKLLIEKGY